MLCVYHPNNVMLSLLTPLHVVGSLWSLHHLFMCDSSCRSPGYSAPSLLRDLLEEHCRDPLQSAQGLPPGREVKGYALHTTSVRVHLAVCVYVLVCA